MSLYLGAFLQLKDDLPWQPNAIEKMHDHPFNIKNSASMIKRYKNVPNI